MAIRFFSVYSAWRNRRRARRAIRDQFEIEFHKAFGWPVLASAGAKRLQEDWELMSDVLAGPLYSILTRGNCDFIFGDPRREFRDIRTVEDFRSWAARFAEDFGNDAAVLEATDSTAAEDRAKLLEQAAAMKRAAELAYQIQKERGRP